MTVINRALLKAYERRPGVDSELEQHPSTVVRGWAKKMRDPLRAPPPAPAAPPEATAADSPVIAATTAESPFPEQSDRTAALPLRMSSGANVRFDPPHAAVSTVPVTELAGVATVPSTTVALPPSDDPPIAWPAVSDRLLASSASADIRQLADRLDEQARSDEIRCIAFSGRGRGAGRTSLIVTLARLLAETKAARIAIVDAHFEHPGVAPALSIQTECGLEAVLRDGECDPREAIWNLNDHVAIVPLCEQVPAEHKVAVRLQSVLRTLKHEFDIVLIDAGPWEHLPPPRALECRAVDAFVSVVRAPDTAAVDITADDIAAAHITAAEIEHTGIHWLGQIDTFVPAAD